MWQVGTYDYDISYAFQPCPLEKNSYGGLKQEYMESYYSTILALRILLIIHKATWAFDRVAKQDHVTNQKHISTTRVPITTKLGRIVT